jgi:hypothetical protein
MSFTHPLLLSPKPSLCAGWRTVGLLRLQPPPLSAPLAWLRPLLATSLRCGALNLRGRRPSMVPGSCCWSSALVFEPVRGVADSRASQAPASTLVRSPRQAVSPALPRRCAAKLCSSYRGSKPWLRPLLRYSLFPSQEPSQNKYHPTLEVKSLCVVSCVSCRVVRVVFLFCMS